MEQNNLFTIYNTTPPKYENVYKKEILFRDILFQKGKVICRGFSALWVNMRDRFLKLFSIALFFGSW